MHVYFLFFSLWHWSAKKIWDKHQNLINCAHYTHLVNYGQYLNTFLSTGWVIWPCTWVWIKTDTTKTHWHWQIKISKACPSVKDHIAQPVFLLDRLPCKSTWWRTCPRRLPGCTLARRRNAWSRRGSAASSSSSAPPPRRLCSSALSRSPPRSPNRPSSSPDSRAPRGSGKKRPHQFALRT